jgi:two-component system OmpR family response regulator
MKILVAEDEPGTRQMLRMYPEGKDDEVTATGDGRAALESVRQSRTDLLPLDIRIPELDGWSAMKTIRSFGSRLPILMIVALDATADAVKG